MSAAIVIAPWIYLAFFVVILIGAYNHDRPRRGRRRAK